MYIRQDCEEITLKSYFSILWCLPCPSITISWLTFDHTRCIRLNNDKRWVHWNCEDSCWQRESALAKACYCYLLERGQKAIIGGDLDLQCHRNFYYDTFIQGLTPLYILTCDVRRLTGDYLYKFNQDDGFGSNYALIIYHQLIFSLLQCCLYSCTQMVMAIYKV